MFPTIMGRATVIGVSCGEAAVGAANARRKECPATATVYSGGRLSSRLTTTTPMTSASRTRQIQAQQSQTCNGPIASMAAAYLDHHRWRDEAQVAALLKARSVRRLVQARRIEYFKVGRLVRFREAAVADHIERNRVVPGRGLADPGPGGGLARGLGRARAGDIDLAEGGLRVVVLP
ncbi:helix-turn-helix domain-containing protein [Dactylosporangium sp. AC04546]|uniref:helix-turn-helix domain-containing protein n=1 Tax=Dactylosporangium sp. AC04546 TaxID=2862460 RepID=UPI001EDF9733|nr:helix-turn-helix domain-containing protein [Dactylosporangium sp. AC04546]WVK82813.1 helix-turn-helix domain-containing protein [Dactylosporangium sp. AC04546]